MSSHGLPDLCFLTNRNSDSFLPSDVGFSRADLICQELLELMARVNHHVGCLSPRPLRRTRLSSLVTSSLFLKPLIAIIILFLVTFLLFLNSVSHPLSSLPSSIASLNGHELLINSATSYSASDSSLHHSLWPTMLYNYQCTDSWLDYPRAVCSIIKPSMS